ncbi:hypothetical protein BAZOLSSOX_2540 [uncultured Gammaproteobacteria bacterium]|nr:hypothetical protein BAZOLSSOX_2540 [uncultured Gammaproteobacteria bacterium]
MTIVGGLRIIDSNAQTGTTWWNWTSNSSSEFSIKFRSVILQSFCA